MSFSFRQKIKSLSSRGFMLSMTGGVGLMAFVAVAMQYFRMMDNLPYYMVLCCAFSLGSAIAYALSGLKLMEKLPPSRYYTAKYPMLMVGVALLIGLWLSFADDLPLNIWSVATYDQPWRFDMGKRALCAIAAVGLAGCTCLLWRRLEGRTPSKAINILLLSYEMVFALISAYLLYMPSSDRSLDFFHRYSYTVEIYNVWRGIPYDISSCGVYGHYGLIFAPILKLMGGCTPENIMLLFPVIAALTSLLVSRTAAHLSDNPLLRLLAPLAFALGYMFMLPTIYPQGFPTRLLLIALLGYGLTKPQSNRSRKCFFRVSSVFALLWMTDMGLVYILSIAVYECVGGIFEKDGKHFVKAVFTSAGWVLTEVGICLLIVNIYNLCTQGNFILRAYIWPLSWGGIPEQHWLVDTARSGRSQLAFFYSYFWIIAFFLGCFLFSLHRGLQRSNQSLDRDSMMLAAIAVYGLGSMVYYIVRPAYPNQFQVFPSLLLCLMIISSGRMRLIDGKPQILGHQYLALAMTAFFVVGTSAMLPKTLKRMNILQASPSHIHIVAQQLKEQVPPDTWATGIGVQEIYAVLGWDCQTTGDVSNAFMNAAVRERLLHELQSQKEFVDISVQMPTMDEEFRNYVQQNFVQKSGGKSGPITWSYYQRR